MLFNAGFELINENFGSYDCMIFHDVDHIPENNRNYYGCSNMPRHFAEELDIHNYKFVKIFIFDCFIFYDLFTLFLVELIATFTRFKIFYFWLFYFL